MGKERLLTSSEVAERLGVSKSTVLNWRDSGMLREATRTKGGHYRFATEDVDRLARQLEGEQTPKFGAGEYEPICVKEWLTKALADSLLQAFSSEAPDQGNVVSAICNYVTEDVQITFSRRPPSECPFRLVQRHGTDSFALRVGFIGTPSFSRGLEALVGFVHGEVHGIFDILRGKTDYSYLSDTLKITELCRSHAFWLESTERQYILSLPKNPTLHEFKVLDTQLLVCERALAHSPEYCAPLFRFINVDSNSDSSSGKELD